MMHKAWSSIEEVPYCFWRSSVKFQGHTGWKIDDLNPVWVRLPGRSQLSNPSDLPCFSSDGWWGELSRVLWWCAILCIFRVVLMLKSVKCSINTYDHRKYRFLAATKQLYKWYFPSVCPSVRLSVTPFDYVPIIVSSWNFQELLPMTKVRSMQKVKVRGQRSRSQRSQPNLTVSGL